MQPRRKTEPSAIRDPELWKTIAQFSSVKDWRMPHIIFRFMTPQLRSVHGAIAITDRTDRNLMMKWWEERNARGRRLQVVVVDSPSERTNDVVSVREENSFAIGVPVAPKDNMVEPLPAVVDVRACRLRALAVRSRHFSTVCISPHAFADSGSTLTIARATTSCLETVMLSNMMLAYAGQSIQALAQISTLKRVSIRQCRMVSGWQDLAHLPFLELLDLTDCKLDLDLRVFRTCGELRRLWIAGNDAHGFDAVSQVTELDCSRCGLDLIASMRKLSRLVKWNVSGNCIEANNFVFALSGMPCLTSLAAEACNRVSMNMIAKSLLAANPVPPLQRLSVGKCPVDEMDALSVLTTLAHVTVFGSGMEKPNTLEFVCRSSLRLLSTLEVCDFDLHVFSLSRLSLLSNSLRVLRLRRCKLTSIAHLDMCKGLEHLDLEGNFLSGMEESPCLELLCQMPVLRVLSLRSAMVEEVDWMKGRWMPTLIHLDLSENTHLHSGGDFVSSCCPHLEVLFLTPSFPFDLKILAVQLPHLTELYHVHPHPMVEPMIPFRSVKTVSIYENHLTHGQSLTFHFLRRLKDLFPATTTLILNVQTVTEALLLIAVQLRCLHTLVLVPVGSFAVSLTAELVRGIPPAPLERLIFVTLGDDEPARLRENQFVRWTCQMPLLLPHIEIVETCPWYTSEDAFSF